MQKNMIIDKSNEEEKNECCVEEHSIGDSHLFKVKLYRTSERERPTHKHTAEIHVIVEPTASSIERRQQPVLTVDNIDLCQ